MQCGETKVMLKGGGMVYGVSGSFFLIFLPREGKGMFGEPAGQTPKKYLSKYYSEVLCYFFSL